MALQAVDQWWMHVLLEHYWWDILLWINVFLLSVFHGSCAFYDVIVMLDKSSFRTHCWDPIFCLGYMWSCICLRNNHVNCLCNHSHAYASSFVLCISSIRHTSLPVPLLHFLGSISASGAVICGSAQSATSAAASIVFLTYGERCDR